MSMPLCLIKVPMDFCNPVRVAITVLIRRCIRGPMCMFDESRTRMEKAEAGHGASIW